MNMAARSANLQPFDPRQAALEPATRWLFDLLGRVQRWPESASLQPLLDEAQAPAASATPPPGIRADQWQRLHAMAPSLLDWALRHRHQPSLFPQLRQHLCRRCERILNEAPHPDYNEE